MLNDPQFWVLVAFIIFVCAIFNPVRKTIVNSLDSKIQEIKNSINEAEKLKNDTRQTLSQIKKRQNEINEEINLINEEATNKIALIEKNLQFKLKEQIDKRHTLKSLKINQMTRDANNEIQKHITNTAIHAALNILLKKLDEKEKQNLLSQSIVELNSILKN